MKIHHLKLVNFRNYEKLDLSFSDSYNIFYGNNGVGKTNLVESIYVLAFTKSFRGSVDKILVMNNKDVCKIEGEVGDKYASNYRIIFKDGGKKVKVDNTKIEKLSDYISKINVVLFNPDDLRFIKDSPSVRRKNVNLEISQLSNSYLKNLNMYEKLLKQRNMYLKTMNINSNTYPEYLEILTNKLVDLGEKIFNSRKKYIDMINLYLEKYYKKICDLPGLRLEYISDFNEFDRNKIMLKYKNCLNKDIILGKTTYGIHHDDFKFLLNDLNLKDYGSEGQQKNAIISYKLCEIDICYKMKNDYPILILDDLFSELDNEKISNILNLINNNVQTFITTTEIDKISNNIIKKSRIYKILDGEIMEG